jgi:hypothetical protein
MGLSSKATVAKSRSIARVVAPPASEIFQPSAGASLTLMGGTPTVPVPSWSPSAAASLVLSGGTPLWSVPSSIAGMKVYYDARSITGLSNNDPVATWPDLSATGINLTQSNGSFKPTYIASGVNGWPCVRHADASGVGMATTGLTIGTPSTLVVIAAHLTSGGSSRRILQATVANLVLSGQRVGPTNSFFLGATVANFAPNDTAIHIFIGGNSANLSYLRVDGTDHTSSATPSASWDNLGTGAAGSAGSERGNCDIYEIVVYNSLLSVANCQLLEAYSHMRYGTP